MKIITRGKGLKEYTEKKGVMVIDFIPNSKDKIWLKMDVALGKEQYIVDLENFELAKLIGLGLQDGEVIKICKRNNWLGGLK